MALSRTVGKMKKLLTQIVIDLEKADRGVKAASQRVRVYTIQFEKVAKVYRKESIAAEKSGLVKKTPAAKKAASARPAKLAVKRRATAKLPKKPAKVVKKATKKKR